MEYKRVTLRKEDRCMNSKLIKYRRTYKIRETPVDEKNIFERLKK